MKWILLALVLSLVATVGHGQEATHPRVSLDTSQGTIVLELYPEEAPKTVDNFLGYVESGHFDGTLFHRVIPGFMIQGGGYTEDLAQKPTGDPIENEADNGLGNERGTVAMARTSDPHSATAQFFINLADNPHLNHTGKNARGWGYTVFARVVEGTDVVDAIAAVPTRRQGPHEALPTEPVVIRSAEKLDG